MPSRPRRSFGVSVTVDPAPVPPTTSSCANRSAPVLMRGFLVMAKQPRLVSSGLPSQLNFSGSNCTPESCCSPTLGMLRLTLPHTVPSRGAML